VTGSPSITSFSTFTALISIAQPPAAGRDAVRPTPPQPQQAFTVPIDRRGPATVVEVGTAKQVEPVPRPPTPRDLGADEKRLQRASDVRDIATLQGTPISTPAPVPAPARPTGAAARPAVATPGPVAAATAATPAAAAPLPAPAEPARPIVPPGSRINLFV